jgi:Mrp family chromosome partitioning ATPase
MLKTKNQYRLPLTENQNETSRKLRDKNSIGFFTSPSQAVIWRPMASKALNQMILMLIGRTRLYVN